MLRSVKGGDVEIHAADLRDAGAIDHLTKTISELDILVNNAGAIPHGSLLELDDAELTNGWQVKVYGHIRMTRGFYRIMKERGGGVIINIIGYAAERMMPTYIAGTCGNAALVAFTKTVGSTSPQDNIRVVGINPGHILTERLRKRLEQRAAAELGDQERWKELTRDYPFGRAGSPAEIADAVAFLASSRAGYISGTIVTVDGGMTQRPMPAS
jgi:NAD(P)-dependent dehydrogenase (short-subunit alcohol dehydrogenase family)